MRKISYIILGTSLALTLLFLVIWFAGLILGQTFGGFIYLLLILAIFTSLGVIPGIILLAVSFLKK